MTVAFNTLLNIVREKDRQRKKLSVRKRQSSTWDNGTSCRPIEPGKPAFQSNAGGSPAKELKLMKRTLLSLSVLALALSIASAQTTGTGTSTTGTTQGTSAQPTTTTTTTTTDQNTQPTQNNNNSQ